MPVTHGDMHALEWQGLLKIDLLGLRTLTFLKHIEEQVKGSQPRFGLESISLDDEKTFALLSRGESVGIFQLESELFQDLLKRMQPRSFAELAALLALGRPGPLSLVPTYLANRAAPEKVHYAHPVLKEILGETYGLAVYQEQVIQLGHRLGGMSRNEADLLRIAISKKDGSLINQLAETFIRGCEENGLSPKDARNLFAVRRFAGYAFNKSHSVCYALISYRARIKAHYPKPFCSTNGGPFRKLPRALPERVPQAGYTGVPPRRAYVRGFHRPEGEGIRLGFAIKHGRGCSPKNSGGTEPRSVQKLSVTSASGWTFLSTPCRLWCRGAPWTPLAAGKHFMDSLGLSPATGSAGSLQNGIF